MEKIKLIISLVVILIACSQLSGQSSIAESNRLMANEEYDQAIKLLLQLEQDQGISADLYANLGAAYFHTGDLARSILYYERGAQIHPGNNQIQQSLELVRGQLPVRITRIPDFILVEWFRTVANTMNSNFWAALQLLTSAILIFLLYFWFFKRREAKWGVKRWTTLIMSLFIITCLAFIAYNKKQYELGGFTAISMANQTIYKSPDERSDNVVIIGPGNKLIILDSLDNWYKVQLADKDIGWCRTDELIVI